MQRLESESMSIRLSGRGSRRGLRLFRSGEGPKEMCCELRRMLEDEVDDVGRFLGFEQAKVNLE